MDHPPVSPSALRSRAAELRAGRVPFVTATVVLVERPASARPGDMAIVLGDGTVLGFVGGECAEASVVAHAQGALGTGASVLLRITPQPEAGTTAEAGDPAGDAALAQPDESGRIVVHNPCLSGGSLEIFLEPELPPPLVVVHGEAPIAQALRHLAGELGYAVGAAETSGELPPDATAVVVASHGRDEAAILRAAIAGAVPYIGLVASHRRGSGVLDALGLSDENRARVHTPAGIDIGAKTPGEVALSILAEVVASRPRGRPWPVTGPEAPAAAAPANAVDPICGMTVAALDTVLHVDHDSQRFWFCGPGCRDAFVADPTSALTR
jgi:xanthine dehydrogenase accessory factor